ncbi:MAG: AAA family ATPase [Salibacteraceae bacterium]
MSIRRIVLTGPESTGKTTLAKELATYFNTSWVAEIARELLPQLGRPYNYNDLLPIAEKQLELETLQLNQAKNWLFCDTGPLVVKVWSEFQFGKSDPKVADLVDAHTYDYYLLCDIDLPWEADPLRENPKDRKELYELYHNELQQRQFPFSKISGNGPERLKNALLALEQFFS